MIVARNRLFIWILVLLLPLPFAVSAVAKNVITKIGIGSPNVTQGKDGTFTITETGPPNAISAVALSAVEIDLAGKILNGGADVGIPDNSHPGEAVGEAKNLDANGKAVFGPFAAAYTVGFNTFVVSDYLQQTGDPGVLAAAAFSGGYLVPLVDWLVANGYTSDSNQIIQPDFALSDNSSLYYAVDLATLLDAGSVFASTFTFGATFTVGATDSIAALPMYQFSTTLPVYIPGSGWSVTPVAPGTVVEYDAFHGAYAVPEPDSLTLLGAGLAVLCVCCRRKAA
jgi:hypothetical protein